jgi:hypothetical protein
MVALTSFSFVYVLVPCAVYRSVFYLSGSRGLGIAAAVASVGVAIVFLERGLKWYGRTRNPK